MGKEVGEVYKFGVRPFRWYLRTHTHVEKLKLILDFASKNRFWHPEIDIAIVKSILASTMIATKCTHIGPFQITSSPNISQHYCSQTEEPGQELHTRPMQILTVCIVWKTIIDNPTTLK